MTERLIEYGKITKPRGLRGEVRVVAFSGDASALETASRVFVKPEGADAPRPFEITDRKVSGAYAVLTFAGVDTREGSDGLRGASVMVAAQDLPEPGEGEYYNFSLIGLAVAEGGKPLGAVTEIVQGGGQSVLVVTDGGGGEILIPMAEKFIERIDGEGGTVVVKNTAALRSEG